MAFWTDATERARIDSSGRLLVGTSSAYDSNDNFVVQKTDGGARIGLQHSSTGQVIADEELGVISFYSNDGDVNPSARISAMADLDHAAGDKPGRLVFSTTADGASSPTERMRIGADGNVLIAKTSGSFSVTGIILSTAGGVYSTTSNDNCIFANRRNSDGSLVALYQDDALEGSISVSGSTVSYNGAHLARWSQLPNGVERSEILRGSVLSNLDEMCEWAYDAEPEVLWSESDELPEGVNVGDVKTPAKAAGTEGNEQLNRMQVSTVEGDRNVAGVFQAWDDDDDIYTDDFYCAMTGDFIIRIAEGVTVQRGDLLMSAGDGTAKPQDDDIIRSKTIAKVTSTHVTCTYDDGSYCVPCVLMAC
jgi:hypothetical protein